MSHRFVKNLATVVGFALVSMVSSNAAVRETARLPEKVFAPEGFDDNDNSQVVLYGHFPDTCFQAGPAFATLDGNRIRIRNLSYELPQGPGCIRAPVPWTTTVDVGVLAVGSYRVYVEDLRGNPVYYVTLNIGSSVKPEQDEQLYAYVNGAMVNRVDPARPPVLTVSGEFNLSCMELDRIETKKTGDVVVVLPIIRLRTDVPCGHVFIPIPFSEKVNLSPNREPTLIHIRSVNGQSINRVID